MKNKTAGIIATISTTLLCLIASIILCIIGMIGITKYNGEYTFNPALGTAFLCFSVLSLFVPVIVGFYTLRNKSDM